MLTAQDDDPLIYTLGGAVTGTKWVSVSDRKLGQLKAKAPLDYEVRTTLHGDCNGHGSVRCHRFRYRNH